MVDAFPVQGPVEGLDPKVLDFRYQPGRGQACLGLPDDPYKTIVGSDGGLYYDYGKRGPEPYDNGQGSFGTRVLAELQAEGDPGPCRQSLHSPRIPIVVTEREQGDWLVRQEAWSGALQGETLEARTPQRVDYLWLTLTNRSRESPHRHGRAECRRYVCSEPGCDSQTGLAAWPGREDFLPVLASLSAAGREWRPSRFGRALAGGSPLGRVGHAKLGAAEGRQRPCFRHVLVGFGQPLEFRFAASANQKFRVAVGLIEGWHAEPGKRPVQVQVEGQPARTVDLVKEPARTSRWCCSSPRRTSTATARWR